MTQIFSELQHIEMTQVWTSTFRKITKKYQTPRWVFDTFTIRLLKAIKEGNQLDVENYYKLRDGVLFSALNRKEKKRISIISIKDDIFDVYAFTDYWDPEYGNYPSLTFLTNNTSESFTEFEDLFRLFIEAKTHGEIFSFEEYIDKRFN